MQPHSKKHSCYCIRFIMAQEIAQESNKKRKTVDEATTTESDESKTVDEIGVIFVQSMTDSADISYYVLPGTEVLKEPMWQHVLAALPSPLPPIVEVYASSEGDSTVTYEGESISIDDLREIETPPREFLKEVGDVMFPDVLFTCTMIVHNVCLF